MIYLPTQPYFKLSHPFKLGLYYYSGLSRIFFSIFAKRKQLTALLFITSLLLGIIYVLEFNAVLDFGRNITMLNTELNKIENELDKNEAGFSKIYATAISLYLNQENKLERVSKIEYLEKKSLAEATQYIP